MKEFNKKVEDIFDLYGIRIVTDTIEDCYAVFGIVHSLFKPLPERLRTILPILRAMVIALFIRQ